MGRGAWLGYAIVTGAMMVLTGKPLVAFVVSSAAYACGFIAGTVAGVESARIGATKGEID